MSSPENKLSFSKVSKHCSLNPGGFFPSQEEPLQIAYSQLLSWGEGVSVGWNVVHYL